MKQVSRAIIVNDKGKVLLGKRANGTDVGKYCLVGGKPDDGETAEEAVIREVKEEIGLEFTPALYLEKVDALTDPNDPWNVTYFIGLATGELRLEPTEVTEIIFVSEGDLDKYDLAFDHKQRLIEFFRTRS